MRAGPFPIRNAGGFEGKRATGKANDLMWAFFKKHGLTSNPRPRPGSSSSYRAGPRRPAETGRRARGRTLRSAARRIQDTAGGRESFCHLVARDAEVAKRDARAPEADGPGQVTTRPDSAP